MKKIIFILAGLLLVIIITIINIPIISNVVSGVLSNIPIIGQVLTLIDIGWTIKYFYEGINISNDILMAYRVVSVLSALSVSYYFYCNKGDDYENDWKLFALFLFSTSLFYIVSNYAWSYICVHTINELNDVIRFIENLRTE